VCIFLYPHSVTTAEEIAEECFRAGADVNLSLYTDRFYSSYARLLSEESLRRPSVYCRGLTELSTAEFWVGGPYDPSIFRKVPPEKMAAMDEGENAAHFPVARDRKVRSLFVSTGLVTRPRAKAYGFSFAGWQRMMLRASSARPDRLAAEGRQIATRLLKGGEVRITSDNGTDLRFSLGGRRPVVNDGVVDDEDIAAGAFDASIPAGSVAVAPREESANGTVVFDVPQAWAGRSIRKLRWQFTDGRVTSWTGDANAEALRKTMEKEGGEKDRMGSLTIGLNSAAELGFLQNPIVRGAVSLSIGANEDLGGANKFGFFHQQTVRDTTLEVDGEQVVRAGRLVLA